MDNKNDYEIKVDGEFHQFEGGGIRYTKTGKGRFDLIPKETLVYVISEIDNMWNGDIYDKRDILIAYCNQNFIEVIAGIVINHYNMQPDRTGRIGHNDFYRGFAQMLRELAIHYEKGADKYGENNWKKGIPLTSFEDSGFRHLCQWMNGETDEPHHISAIWNMMCWLYLSA